MNFSKNLKEIRIQKGLTMEQIADVLGITKQGYSYYESGLSSPTLEKVQALADALNVPICQLIEPEQDQPKDITPDQIIKIIDDYSFDIIEKINGDYLVGDEQIRFLLTEERINKKIKEIVQDVQIWIWDLKEEHLNIG